MMMEQDGDMADSTNQFNDMLCEFLEAKKKKQPKICEYIGFFQGRPKRITIISKDEIVNLKIELNMCKDIDDFISAI